MSDAADRLAQTRLAIVQHVHGRKHPQGDHPGPTETRKTVREHEARVAASVAANEYEAARARGRGWFASIQRAAGTWWRHHPAHLGLEVATPLLSAYAARRPATYLGIAALAGAVIVVTRPWRLISATGLIVAIVKSSQLSSMVMSALSAADFEKDHRMRF